MSKSMFCVTTAALAAALLTSPTTAQPAPDPHHSMERVILKDWITRVESELGRQLSYRQLGGGSQSGVVRIKFNCSENGHADKVAVARSSGSHDLDREALMAVKRIAVMHPLATGLNTSQVFFADILFATQDDQAYRRHLASIQASALKNNGWFKAPPELLSSR